MMTDNKLDTYNKALADVIKELSSKRSELYALANTTIDQLQTNIPRLRNEVKGLENEIKQLKDVIKDKKFQALVEQESCIAKYNKLEEELKNTYLLKETELKRLEDLARKETENARNDCVKAERIRQEADVLISEYNNKMKDIISEASKVKEDRAVLDKDIQNQNENIKSRLEDLKNQESHNLLLKASLDDGHQLLKEKFKESEIIIAKLKEVEAREKLATDIEIKNTERTTELNTFNAKNKADMVRNSKRTEEINELDRKLKEREENLRILEAKV